MSYFQSLRVNTFKKCGRQHVSRDVHHNMNVMVAVWGLLEEFYSSSQIIADEKRSHL